MNAATLITRTPHGRRRGILLCLALSLLAGESPAANFIVRMQGTRFVPQNITISVGDSITWTNLDFTSHDSVSGTNGVPSGFWRTPLFGRGGSATVVFTNIAPRSYGYYCTPHVFVGMVGSVTVLAPNTPPTVVITEPADGALVPAGVPLTIRADPRDADGRVVRVDFSVDGVSIGSGFLGSFTTTYANPLPGNHILRAVAVDDRGATSAPALVTITALLPPSIVQQPANTNAIKSTPVSFSVVATGGPPLSLQWQHNGVEIPGATNETYYIPSVIVADEGDYAVIVRNPVGSITSHTARLTVTANLLPDVNLLSPNPTNDLVVAGGATVLLLAEASDPDGEVRQVDFFLGTNLVATVTNAPYTYAITNLAPGDYEVVAEAVDNENGVGRSQPGRISAVLPPTISLTSPHAGQVFPLGTPIPLTYETTNRVASGGVELFANGISLGKPDSFLPPIPDRYELIATVTDVVGQRGTSSPVAVIVYDPADDTSPTLTLTTSKPNFARLHDDYHLQIAGHAGDDVGLARVELLLTNQFSMGTNILNDTTNWLVLPTVQPGVHSVDWTTNVALWAGQNYLLARSVDLTTNYSMQVTRYFTFVTFGTLLVKTEGSGSVTPNLTNQLLEVGRSYRLTARPDPGHVFTNWEGVASAQGAILDFVMQPDLHQLTAHFVPSPFNAVAGAYACLIQDTNTFAPDGNGLVTISVTKSGAFSGRFRAAGRNLAFRGQLDHERRGQAIALRPGQTPIRLDLQFGTTNSNEELIGTATDGFWTANLVGGLNPYAARTPPSPHAGARAFVWRLLNATNVVASTYLKISTRGKVSLTATFAGGRRLRSTSETSRFGWIPVGFSSGKQDSLVGWAHVGETGDLRVVGDGVLIPPGITNQPADLIIVSPSP